MVFADGLRCRRAVGEFLLKGFEQRRGEGPLLDRLVFGGVVHVGVSGRRGLVFWSCAGLEPALWAWVYRALSHSATGAKTSDVHLILRPRSVARRGGASGVGMPIMDRLTSAGGNDGTPLEQDRHAYG